MNVNEVNEVITNAVDQKSAALVDQVNELKNVTADLEAKIEAGAAAPAAQNAEFDVKAANAVLREAMSGDKQVEIKALTIGGSGGEALAIDDELGRTVTERARENVAILGAIGSKNVGSVNYRELVLRQYPEVGTTGENTTLSGADWSATTTQTYEEVTMKVGKQYAKPQISDEAVADPHIDLMAHLEKLLGDEMSRYWAQAVLAGDGGTNAINGILFDSATTGHLDTRDLSDDGTKGESWKEDAGSRDPSKFPVIATGAAGAFPSTSVAFMDKLIDMTVAVPSAYLGSSKFYMNRKTLGSIRKLRDAEERPLIQFEAGSFTLLGYEVVLEDYMPVAATDSFPIIFGDLASAYSLCDIDTNYLLDPYSVDGAVQIKASARKGSLMGANDAIVVLMCTDKDGE